MSDSTHVNGSEAVAAVTLQSGTVHETSKESVKNDNPLLRMDPGMVIWTWVIFIALLVILSKYAWRPIMNLLDEREKNIQKSLTDVESAKQELAAAESLRAKILKEAEDEAIEIINRSRIAAQNLAMDLNKKAHEESERVIEGTKRVLVSEKEKAMASLKKETVVLAVSVAEKLIRSNLNNQKNSELAEQYLEEMVREK